MVQHVLKKNADHLNVNKKEADIEISCVEVLHEEHLFHVLIFTVQSAVKHYFSCVVLCFMSCPALCNIHIPYAILL